MEEDGAEGRSRTDTGLPPPVFETGASTIPPLRLAATKASETIITRRTPTATLAGSESQGISIAIQKPHITLNTPLLP